MIYKNISSKYIISKIFRDTNPQNDNWITDAIEWMGEALEFIGTVPQYRFKAETLSITGHKAYLPCDLYLIEQVSYNGVPMRYSSNTFPYGLHCSDCISAPNSTTNNTFVWVANPNEPNDSSENFVPVKTGFNGFSTSSYYIDNNYIKTSFEEGDICIFYRAFTLDEDGYPLVPDYVQFKEAIYWYVRTKMIGAAYFNDPIFSYADAEARWLKYCQQARAKADTPSIDQMESIKNQWVRLIPQMNAHKEFFQKLGTEETLYRQYGTGGLYFR